MMMACLCLQVSSCTSSSSQVVLLQQQASLFLPHSSSAAASLLILQTRQLEGQQDLLEMQVTAALDQPCLQHQQPRQ
jgi:hypothetical protein